MNKEKKQQLNNLNVSELQVRLEETRRELFGVRLHAATSPLKDHTQFKKLRRTIARILTYIRQKESFAQRTV